jgi:glyoxylase-like metal-dependent hydrolase (beta-lactamase superfamily II)
LYEPKTKSLFSGDTVFPYGGVGRTDFPEGSLKEMKKSLERLSKLDVKILYPGHGEVTSDDMNRQIRNSLKLTQSFS